MYNRYVPQPDGSYRRNSRPDPIPTPAPRPDPPPQPAPPPPSPARRSYVKGPYRRRVSPPTPPQKPVSPPKRPPESSVGGFFRNLLPKNFDTGDLLIVLLLLLIAGDCPDDQNTALLTLVLYLFL